MVYSKIKVGLILFILGIVVMLVGSICNTLIANFTVAAGYISFAGAALELVGLIICACDHEKNFKVALFLLILSVIFLIVASIILAVAESQKNQTLVTVGGVFTILVYLLSLFVAFFVIKGCKIVSTTSFAKGISTVSLLVYTLGVLFAIAVAIVVLLNTKGTITVDHATIKNLKTASMIIEVFSDALFVVCLFSTRASMK